MAKRFKLKISRFLFQSCRSKDPSDFPSNPVPSFSRLSSLNPNPITLHLPPSPPQQTPHCSSLKRHVSSAFSSMGCGLRSRSSAPCFSETERSQSPPPLTSEFHWEREDGWHVIAKVLDDDETPRRKIYYTSDNNNDLFISPSKPPNTEKRKRRWKKKKTTPKTRIRKSSVESFDDEETESLVSSSGSFTTDSSSTIRKTMIMGHRKRMKKNRKVKKATRRSDMMRLTSSESESPARLSSFLQRMVPCTVDGKVSESFAVVKKSEDPCKDFKQSMMEMIFENQMFENEDLEQLLHCFLSLNSRHHHGAVVQAFAEIWETLFSTRSTSSRVSFAFN
ncbi:Transcription repressor OFP8 [Hibiscus syriacus]|uniref:Transcription repressor n=1 Tax=Hibiscus syriacus TaxID=106335 RepID=A0A6A2WAY4_HIBSY|nr:transcription repressor OFP7-like [Hibiscus syriacus]KAE8655102.1 Transcription repressor OFP8 [Hibiscus syriacus]